MRWLVLVMLAACAQASSREQPMDAPPSHVDAAPPDTGIDATVCAMSPCDIPSQCGCTDTQACDIDFSDFMGNACRVKADTGVEGHTCGGLNGPCARKYVCLGSGSNRSCERYCAADSDCIGPRGQCVIQITANNQPIPGAVTCTSNCDPAAASNPLCPPSWTCDLFTATFQAVDHQIVDCRPAGAATQNQACSATVACAAGLTCVTQGTAMKCAKVCTPPANTGCPGGTTCTAFGTPFTVGGTQYGACL